MTRPQFKTPTGDRLKGGGFSGRSVGYSGFLIMKDDDLAVFNSPSLGNPLPDYSVRIKEEEKRRRKTHTSFLCSVSSAEKAAPSFTRNVSE